MRQQDQTVSQGRIRHTQARPGSTRNEYYVRVKEAPKKSAPLECDIHTGCHARITDPDTSESFIVTSTNSEGQQISLSAANTEQATTTLDDEEDYGESSNEESDDESAPLDDSEQLKELYRNCHHSAGNRYSHLVNCSAPEALAAGDNIEDYQQSHLDGLKYSKHSHNSDRIEFAPGTVTLFLVALLLVAIMLVEIVDVLYRARKRLSDEAREGRRRRKRRLRARAPRFIIAHSSPVLDANQNASEKSSSLFVESMT